MDNHKSLIMHIAEWWETYSKGSRSTKSWSHWLPSPGNVLFTLLIAGLLIFTQQTWANNGSESVNAPGPSATTVNYQGRLAAPDGTPKNGTFGMTFAIYDAASGGNLVWGPESHSAVPVTNGLFNVGLGSLTSGGIPTTVWNGDRYLQITVGGETLTPRELIRSVPIAGMALTVPDGSITQIQAPSLMKSASLNKLTQSGHASVNITQSTDLATINITFDPPYTQRPVLFLQPYYNYTRKVVAVPGDPCTGTSCTIFLSRVDGQNWSPGNYQSIDWIAVGTQQ